MSNVALQQVGVASAKRSSVLGQYFYFSMSLLVAGVVVYGFSFTVGERLIHPVIPRPWILYVHAAIFSGWLIFFILQSTLIRTHNVRLHQRIGWFGVALGSAMPIVGVSTAIVMARFDTLRLGAPDVDGVLLVSLFDMLAFTSTFTAAVYFRKKPEFHRRLILIATCALTAAAFGRFPERVLPHVYFYAGVDLLILLGVVRDTIVNSTLHKVYLCVLPAFILGQTIVTYTAFHNLPYWTKIAHAILW